MRGVTKELIEILDKPYSDTYYNKKLSAYPEINGTRAGTSLKGILLVLLENKYPFEQIIGEYGISYCEIDPRKNKLCDILKVFSDNDVKSREIISMFGCWIGVDFIDLLYAYKMGKITDE